MKISPKNPSSSFNSEVEKCMALAQKAIASGDRILAEQFYQQAEHYVRLNSKVKKSQIFPIKRQKPIAKNLSINDFATSIEQELEQELSAPKSN